MSGLFEMVLIGLLVAMTEVVEVLEGTRRWALVCADNEVVLPLLGDGAVGVTLGDPPYDAKTHEGARTNRASGVANLIDFAALASLGHVAHGLRVSRRWVLFFCALEQLGSYKAEAGPAWIRAGVWDRPDGMPQLTGDRPAQGAEGLAIIHPAGRKRWGGGGSRAFWTHGTERTDRAHPTQKPLPLMLDLVGLFSDEDEVVLDPFAGSGTTGVACIRLGRRFIGIEKSPEYAAVARERLEAESQGLSLRAARAGQLPLLGAL